MRTSAGGTSSSSDGGGGPTRSDGGAYFSARADSRPDKSTFNVSLTLPFAAGAMGDGFGGNVDSGVPGSWKWTSSSKDSRSSISRDSAAVPGFPTKSNPPGKSFTSSRLSGRAICGGGGGDGTAGGFGGSLTWLVSAAFRISS